MHSNEGLQILRVDSTFGWLLCKEVLEAVEITYIKG
jgi:hypothetical protein